MALKQAKLRRAKGDRLGAEISAKAAVLLETTWKKLGVLRRFVEAPWASLSGDSRAALMDAAKAVRDLKSDLVLLTRENDFGPNSDGQIPRLWQENAEPDVAKEAALIFRTSLYRYLSGGNRKSKDPLAMGFFQRWQEAKVWRAANQDPSASSVRDAYRKQWMSALGVYPEYTLPQLQEDELKRRASEKLAARIEADEALRNALNALDETARERQLVRLYAEMFLSEYIDETDNKTTVPILDPAQPGRFQRLRQTPQVRRSVMLTRLVRGVEAFWPEHSARLGLGSWLGRTIPGYADFVLANTRAYKGALTSATGGYLVNRYLWLNALPPAMWLMSLVFRFTYGAPTQFLNRAFKLQGVQLMRNALFVFGFAFVFSWATFWGAIPQQLFAGDFSAAWEKCQELLMPGKEPEHSPNLGPRRAP
jgi:hypothetical protein